MQQVTKSLVLCLLFCASVAAQSTSFRAKVIGVVDGDTITVMLPSGAQQIIRLQGIDAPELDQENGQEAKAFLLTMLLNRKVLIDSNKRDRYGRLVGKVFLNNQDICLALIEQGFAWHFKKYESEQSDSDRTTYAASETKARQVSRGLWSGASPVPPWVYRQTPKTQESATVQERTFTRPRTGSLVVPPSSQQYGHGSSPSSESMPSRPVQVRAHDRSDGTHVRAHTRAAPRRN